MEQNETRTLWISIGAALFSVVLLWGWAQGKKAELDKKFRTKTTVVVAKEDIKEMSIIDESMLDVIEIPPSFVQPSALKDPESIVGQVAATPIQKNEQILNTKLLLLGEQGGLAMQITPEKRAVTIPIDNTRGSAKLLKPGDRIDLIAALDIGSGNEKKREVRTILQDITILATGPRVVNNLPMTIEQQKDSYQIRNLKVSIDFTTITVEVKPIEAQNLIYILSTNPGALYTVLRNPSDRLLYSLGNTTINDVLKKVKRVAYKKPASTRPKKKKKTRSAPRPKRTARPKNGIYEEI